jgi:hypothetical protein
MKHDVHLFCLVRVKCSGIEAESHDAAAKKAMERFHDLYGLFETANCRQLPEGMTDVEFGEEFSHALVDEADDREHERSTWHDAKGDAEPFVVEKPLSAREFRDLMDAEGHVRLAISVSLDELHGCADIDAFNELVDARLYGDGVHGCLTDLVYQPLRVEDGRVVIEVAAATEELELEDDGPEEALP